MDGVWFSDDDDTDTAGLYLSRHDVRVLAHYAFYIPINRGFHREHVARHYPGWSWEQLYPTIRAKAPLSASKGAFSAAHLPEPFVGVLVHTDGTVELDDGSMDNTAKQASTTGRCGFRLSEQVRSTDLWAPSPVVVHAPHTSRHIPSAVRSELTVTDSELDHELDEMTDAGVAEVIGVLRQRSCPALFLQAAFSRLVFDAERFTVGEPMDEVGMGFVYTKRADGAQLREPVPAGRLAWYRDQHAAYTASVERAVATVVDRHERAVIVDLHSYPRHPLGYENSTADRPEVCVGTDDFHTPGWLLDEAMSAFCGFDVAVNSPFAGAYVPWSLYRRDDRVSSIMVEVRRDVLAGRAGRARVAAALADLIGAVNSRVDDTARQAAHSGPEEGGS